MDLHAQIDALDDEEAVRRLNAVLKAMTVGSREKAMLVGNESELLKALRDAVAGAGADPHQVAEPTGVAARGAASRALLQEFASTPNTRPYVDRALTDDRAKLLEPVTTALVLAGIIFALSTDVQVEFTDEGGGKRKLSVKLHKKPTSDKILAKFFGLFGK